MTPGTGDESDRPVSAAGSTPPGQQPATGPPDLRLIPVAAAGWAAAWIGTSGWPVPAAVWVVLGLVLLGAVLVAVIRRAWWIGATVIMFVGTAAAAGVHVAALERAAVHRLAASEAVARVEVVITDDPTIRPADGVRPAYLTIRGTVRTVAGRGQRWRERSPVLITASDDAVPVWQRLPVGVRVGVAVRLQLPEPGSDLAAVGRAISRPDVVEGPAAADRLVEQVRAGLRAAVAGGSPDQRALVPSLVLGDTAGITPQLRADFLATGLTHLTAVSGANLAILLAFLVVVARWAGLRGWWLRVVGLSAVVVFVALCRTEPSVLRAAAMGLVALAALGVSGRDKGLRSLCVAMIVLLVADPWLGRSLGFALSVLATGGIVWFARSWSVVMSRWAPMIIAESIMLPLAAQLATLPLAAAISGQVSVSGILTNAVAGPFVGPATVLGFAAAGLSLVSPWSAGVVGWLACWAAQPILWTAQIGARLPGASWTWPTSPVGLILLSAGCLLLALAMPLVVRRPWFALGLAVLMIVGVIRPPVQPGWPPPDWVVVACDVGQGDGLAVRSGDHQAVVIDTGPDPAPMRRCLDQLGIREVPLLILTHYHADHVGGLDGVLTGRRVGRIWTSPYPSPPVEAAAVRTTTQVLRIPVSIPAVGTHTRIGATEISVIGPVDRGPTALIADDGQSSTENDLSVTAMITVQGTRLLFTGDLEPEEQRRVLATGVDLHADVLKVPHHGSSRQDPAFIAASGARIAIASAGIDNDYGHPAPRTMQLLQTDGMTAVCTCRLGSIAVTRSEGRLGMISQRGQ